MLNRLDRVFESFERRDVRYLVIGGVAAVIYGVPRATFDLDILIEPTRENARALLDALLDAGLATAVMTTPQDVCENEITIFQDRVRIDVQSRTPGIQFDDAWGRRVAMEYGERRFWVVSKEDLIASKRAAGRPVDLEDVRVLTLDR